MVKIGTSVYFVAKCKRAYGMCRWGRSLSVRVNFGTYNFGTWVFGAVNFGILNVNFSTCHIRYMTDQLRYMSISIHSATMTDIPSCCVLDSRYSQADLLFLKAYVEERSRHVLFMGTHCCRHYSFQYLRCYACCLTRDLQIGNFRSNRIGGYDSNATMEINDDW